MRLVALIIGFGVLSTANCRASMMYTPPEPAAPMEKVIKAINGDSAKSDSEKKNLVAFVTLQKTIFGVPDVDCLPKGWDKWFNRASITAAHLRCSMGYRLAKKDPDWKLELDLGSKQEITSQKGIIENVLGENSYETAHFWSLAGQKEKAIATLRASFEEEYKKIMAYTSDTYDSMSGDQAYPARRLNETLNLLGDTAESESRKEKYRKIEIHISNVSYGKPVT